VDDLPRRLRLDPEELETALEKLWIHGGARFTTAGGRQLVARGGDDWRGPYRRQREHRREQLDEMQRFADGHACRMAALARHFGDQEDTGRPCGICDVCDADACLVRSAREATPAEQDAARRLIEALRRRDGQATGRLHTECGDRVDRRGFEEVVGGLARARLVRVTADTFEKEGRTIPFQRVWLAPEARTSSLARLEFTMPKEAGTPAGAGPERRRGRRPTPASPAAAVADTGLVARLRAWRLEEARRAGVPAFCVLHNRTLVAIAALRPQDEAALLAVPGIGPALLKRYGARILALCRAPAAEPPAPDRRPSGSVLS
jgi:DNA topoisomerase-3